MNLGDERELLELPLGAAHSVLLSTHADGPVLEPGSPVSLRPAEGMLLRVE
jgi:hypothetical protein